MKTETPIAFAECKHGAFWYPAHDRFIGRSLSVYGVYSDAEVGMLQKLVRAGDVVVEVGANIGYMTVDLARRVGPAGRVIAFEPQPEIFRLLLRNVAQNGFGARIDARQQGVGAERGALHLPPIDYAQAGNFGGVSLERDKRHGGRKVEVVTLDSLNLARLDLLKIDAEGMEPEVLLGARETILRHRPLLYLESDRDERRRELLEILDALGYRGWWHLPPLYSPHNPRGAMLNIFPGIVSLNLIGAPNERKVRFMDLRPVAGLDDRPLGQTETGAAPAPGQKTAGVYRPGAIGDAFFGASILTALKREGYHVTVYTEVVGGAVYANNPNVDRLVVNDKDAVPPEAVYAFCEQERGKFDRWINLVETVEGTCTITAGRLQHAWPAEAVRALVGRRNFYDVVGQVAGVTPEIPRFYPTAEERATGLAHLMGRGSRPVCILAPIGSIIAKRYPYTVELAVALEASGLHVIILGDVAFEGVDWHTEHIRVLGNKLPLRDVLTLCTLADYVVGQDTGLLHAAAANPRIGKVVLLSVASAYQLTRDWPNTIALRGDVPCHPCHKIHHDWTTCVKNEDTNAAACQSAISVEAVMTAVRRLAGAPLAMSAEAA
jgi:FkbM family methyltransferase